MRVTNTMINRTSMRNMNRNKLWHSPLYRSASAAPAGSAKSLDEMPTEEVNFRSRLSCAGVESGSADTQDLTIKYTSEDGQTVGEETAVYKSYAVQSK